MCALLPTVDSHSTLPFGVSHCAVIGPAPHQEGGLPSGYCFVHDGRETTFIAVVVIIGDGEVVRRRRETRNSVTGGRTIVEVMEKRKVATRRSMINPKAGDLTETDRAAIGPGSWGDPGKRRGPSCRCPRPTSGCP